MLKAVLSGLAALCVGLAVAVAPTMGAADLRKGVAADRAGYYDTAFAEFRKLAEEGDMRGQFNLGDRGVYHRLQAGPFDRSAAARAACDRLREALPQQDCIAVRTPAPDGGS